MLKELRYLFYIFFIFLFCFLLLKFYFSDVNKKKSYRSFKKNDEKIIIYSKNLDLLVNDTNEIVKYVQNIKDKDKKNFNFWKLITNNDK